MGQQACITTLGLLIGLGGGVPANFFPGLVLTYNPSYLCLLSIWDYRGVLSYLAENDNLSTLIVLLRTSMSVYKILGSPQTSTFFLEMV
jgi:hypothetical protein